MKTKMNPQGLLDDHVLQDDKRKSSNDSISNHQASGQQAPPLKSSFRFAFFWFGLPVLVLVLMAYLQRRP